MCGISVYIGPSREKAINFINKANELQRHRGPDGVGVYSDDMIALGHRRLAIQDLSNAGHQPMISANGSIIIVFNGEIYNHWELRKKYCPDLTFKSSSDTETILAIYEKFGTECFKKMVGMWAMAIWDKRHGKLIMSRDRYGQKPLYWKNFSDGSIRFSSEIKPLLEEKNYLYPTAVAEYLALGNYGHLGEKTFFSGIHLIPPSSYCIINAENPKVEPQLYWKFPYLPYQEKRAFDTELKNELRGTIEKAVGSQLLSDVKVGATLSGGLDSTVVVSLISKLSSNSFPVFTAQTKGSKYDESKYVKAVEEKLGKDKIQLHWKELMTLSLSKTLYSTLHIQEEPFGDPSIIAHGMLMDAAKENNTKVVLGGQGSDEIFFGYGFMTSALLAHGIRRGKVFWALDNMQLMNFSTSNKSRVFLSALFPSLERKLRKGSRNSRRNWLSDKLVDCIEDHKIMLANSSNIHEISLESVERIHLPHLVHYDDRNAMARSIEGRMPFLDHRISEVLSIIRPEYFLNKGKNKTLLRDACEDIIPSSILERRDKIGFYTPLYEMIQVEKEWVSKLLQDDLTRDLNLFNMDVVKADIEKIRNNGTKENNAYLRIWRSLCVRVWAEMYNVNWG